MCVAYPGKVVGLSKTTAEVDFGGNLISIRIGVVDVKVGDYVLAHAGMALEAMSEKKARDILDAFAAIM